MKILFLVYHGFSQTSGISKKIHYQVKGLRENGHEVHLCYYDFSPEGHRCRYIDGEVLRDYGTGKLAGLRQRLDYTCIYEYCELNGIQMVYARSFQNANPWLVSFFRKLREAGIRSVTEVPTYPYDQEFAGGTFEARMKLRIDRLYRRQLAREQEAIVTFSDAQTIFGQRTIRISNGVDFDSIPLHRFQPVDDAIHLIGVAEVHYWHGYDRLLAGIGEYYRQGGTRRVVFHVVGGVAPSEMHTSPYAPGFAEVISKYGIQDHVVLHGTLFGAELDRVFNMCQFAVGSLGRHRSGITVIKTLKNREYATRGIPFIYSEQDSDFDHQSYVLKAPADESPVSVQAIIDFVDNFTAQPQEIRQTVAHLTWKIQMGRVVEEVSLNK